MEDDDLARLRAHINDLDERILELLNERAATALKTGEVKAARHAEVYDPDRERAVLDRIAALNRGPLDKGAVEEVFNAIITVCREIQIHDR